MCFYESCTNNLSQLQQKVKGLLAENNDLRGEREVIASITEQVCHCVGVVMMSYPVV